MRPNFCSTFMVFDRTVLSASAPSVSEYSNVTGNFARSAAVEYITVPSGAGKMEIPGTAARRQVLIYCPARRKEP